MRKKRQEKVRGKGGVTAMEKWTEQRWYQQKHEERTHLHYTFTKKYTKMYLGQQKV